MQSNILEYLDETVKKHPDKIAFAGQNETCTFTELYRGIRTVGSALCNMGVNREAVLVFMEQSPSEIMAFMGVIAGGCYYVPLDEEMPVRRIEKIIESTKASLLICDAKTREKAEALEFNGKIVLMDDLRTCPIDEEALDNVRKKAIDTDPIYVLFTSGSTGIPKGVVGYHRGVIDYIEQLSDVLELGENTVFGNQAPLYYDASMKDIYPTMKFGATTYLIPRNLFLSPIQLVEYLNDKKINTICWVVSALTIISSFNTFDVMKPEYLRTIAFVGEMFPVMQFNRWKDALPGAKFVNLYGPTECTGVNCYYYADRKFELNEVIPIGKPFRNTEVMLITKDGELAKEGEEGEICIRGTCVTHGYYNNPEKTEEVFVQNPLNHNYREIIYRTGDIGKYNDQGDLVFVSRKDHQIKHMGNRIELGEIDSNVAAIEEIRSCCSIYDKENAKIVLFYEGNIEKKQLTKDLKQMLPRYMLPNAIIQLDSMPLMANGKKNRFALQEIYTEQKKPGKK